MKDMSSDSSTPANEKTAQEVEKLLETANSASQTVAALQIAFLAFVAYVGVIVWGTSHEDMLRISPVKLPILDVELPLTAFYNFVPWMVVLLHFNLLMQLELLSCKLWNLDSYLTDDETGKKVRDRLFIFPFAQLIVGRSNATVQRLLAVVVGITMIALPLFILLAAQIRFLPFHDESITWSQRLAVWADVLLLLSLWPLTASPSDKADEWWRGFFNRLFDLWPRALGYLLFYPYRLAGILTGRRINPAETHKFMDKPHPNSGVDPKGMIALLISAPLVVAFSIVAVVPGTTTLQDYLTLQGKNPAHDQSSIIYFEDWLIRHTPKSWLSVATYQNDEINCATVEQSEHSDASLRQVMFGPCALFNWDLFQRNLNLKEARLVPKEVTLSQLTRATDTERQNRDNALKEFDGLNLQNRDLRFANLYAAVLPKADLRHVQLQGAILLRAKLQGIIGWDKTHLQSAILGGTQLQGAGLIEADLRNADLRGANMQGTDLSWASFESADLRGADLKGANLQGAKLQGADLRGALLQGASFKNAKLQAANLSYANLQAIDLSGADLQGALLYDVLLQGSNLKDAKLDWAYIRTQQDISFTDDRQLKHIESTLKPMLTAESFNTLHERLQPDKLKNSSPSSKRLNCYYARQSLLDCNFNDEKQLETYRKEFLFTKLIALACEDITFATGIAQRANDAPNDPSHPDFGLAGALIGHSQDPNHCPGIEALSQHTRKTLTERVGQQREIMKN